MDEKLSRDEQIIYDAHNIDLDDISDVLQRLYKLNAVKKGDSWKRCELSFLFNKLSEEFLECCSQIQRYLLQPITKEDKKIIEKKLAKEILDFILVGIFIIKRICPKISEVLPDSSHS